MKTLLTIAGGIAVFFGIFAILAVRVGAKAESEAKRIIDNFKND